MASSFNPDHLSEVVIHTLNQVQKTEAIRQEAELDQDLGIDEQAGEMLFFPIEKSIIRVGRKFKKFMTTSCGKAKTVGATYGIEWRRSIACLLILLWLSVAASVKAQDASPTPTSTPTPTAEEQRLIDENRLLTLQKDKAGGNNRVRKNLIRFFTGPKVDHSGGLVVDYTLYKKTGEVVYSDELSIYGGYLEPKKIQKQSDRIESLRPKKFEDAVP